MEETKVHFAQKNHSPVYLQSSHLISNCFPQNDLCPNHSIVPGDRGKVHFVEPRSDVLVERSGKKLVLHREHGEYYDYQKKRHLDPIIPKNREMKFLGTLSRHFDNPVTNKDNDEFRAKLPHPTWRTLRHLTPNESKVYDMESDMNRKKRVPLKEDMRNGVPEKNLGDKYYKEADREPDFYAKGGIIPGSTITFRKRSKPTMRKSEDLTARPINSLKKTIPFSEKVKMMEVQDYKQEIKYLDHKLQKNGQTLPSWEERTNNVLCDSDDD